MEKVKVSFLVKTTKEKENGTCPLYCRISVGTETKELFLKSHLTKDDWDRTKQRVKPQNPEASLINSLIDKTRSDANGIAADLRLTDQVVRARLIKDRLSGNSNATTLIQLFTKHNTDIKSRIGNDYSAATLTKYELTIKKVSAFLIKKQQRNDIQLQELKFAFIDDFHNFLKADQKLGHNSAMKHLKNLKKIVRLAQQRDIIEKNPFDEFKCTVKVVNRNCLTLQELDRLISKESLNSRLETVRDVFVFCCYTGLSYADVVKLNTSHIQSLNDGFRTLIIPRTKTKVLSRIPLLPAAEALIRKYHAHSVNDHNGRLFPVSSNQKMNEYLKEIATLCDISNRLTVHLARHTFATTVALQNGVSLEVIKTILGHTNVRTTQLYSKMTDPRLNSEMAALRNKLNDNNKTNHHGI